LWRARPLVVSGSDEPEPEPEPKREHEPKAELKKEVVDRRFMISKIRYPYNKFKTYQGDELMTVT